MLFLRDKLYIPKKEYRKFSKSFKRKIKSTFRTTLFNPNLCILKIRGIGCELFKKDRKACFTCKRAEFKINLLKKHKEFVTVERGDLGLIYNLFKDYQIKDQTKFPTRKYDFNFLWNNVSDKHKGLLQKRAVDDWMKYGYGQVCSPPRSGKSLLAVLIAAKLDTRVLILAHQEELLDQFYNSFVNFTDIMDVAKLERKKLIEINPREDEIKDLSVCLYTYQHFISKAGKKRLSKIKNSFGFMVVDEVHRASASCFSKVAGKINSKYRLGLSATPKRKDGMHFKGNLILGPVVVNALSEQLSCEVKVVNTNIVFNKFSRWTTFVKMLTEHNQRNKLIVKYIEKDLKKGHKIIVPVNRTIHIDILLDLLKPLEDDYTIAGVHGNVPKNNRKEIMKKAKKGKIDVLIATRQLVYLGLDIPPFNLIYNIIPIANKENWYQEVSRVRTTYAGKKTPTARHFVDDNRASYACFNIMNKVNKELGFKQVEEKSIISAGETWE